MTLRAFGNNTANVFIVYDINIQMYGNTIQNNFYWSSKPLTRSTQAFGFDQPGLKQAPPSAIRPTWERDGGVVCTTNMDVKF